MERRSTRRSRPAPSDLISLAVKQPTGWSTDGNWSRSQLHHFPNRLSGADSAAQRAGWEDLLRTWLAKGDRRITVKTPPNGGVSIIGRTHPRENHTPMFVVRRKRIVPWGLILDGERYQKDRGATDHQRLSSQPGGSLSSTHDNDRRLPSCEALSATLASCSTRKPRHWSVPWASRVDARSDHILHYERGRSFFR